MNGELTCLSNSWGSQADPKRWSKKNVEWRWQKDVNRSSLDIMSISSHDVTPGPNPVPVQPLRPLTKPLSRKGLVGRKVLKKFLYSQMALRTGLMIAIGREQPYVRFTVEGDPPSVYWLFRIRADAVDGLAKRLGLPADLKLAPIRCLVDDEPSYFLTLNVYRVSGLANGIRAEWSVYIDTGDGVARYMVVDARSSQPSMDPVGVITKKSSVLHARDGLTVTTTVGDGVSAFTSTIGLPEEHDREYVTGAPEFATANDLIYWGNGICDRTFYDAGMAAARQIRVTNAVLRDGTPWAQIVDPEPVHVLVFCDPIALVVSPWENLSRLKP